MLQNFIGNYEAISSWSPKCVTGFGLKTLRGVSMRSVSTWSASTWSVSTVVGGHLLCQLVAGADSIFGRNFRSVDGNLLWQPVAGADSIFGRNFRSEETEETSLLGFVNGRYLNISSPWSVGISNWSKLPQRFSIALFGINLGLNSRSKVLKTSFFACSISLCCLKLIKFSKAGRTSSSSERLTRKSVKLASSLSRGSSPLNGFTLKMFLGWFGIWTAESFELSVRFNQHKGILHQ